MLLDSGLSTHSNPVTVTAPVIAKFYNCANGDGLSDR